LYNIVRACHLVRSAPSLFIGRVGEGKSTVLFFLPLLDPPINKGENLTGLNRCNIIFYETEPTPSLFIGRVGEGKSTVLFFYPL